MAALILVGVLALNLGTGPGIGCLGAKADAPNVVECVVLTGGECFESVDDVKTIENPAACTAKAPTNGVNIKATKVDAKSETFKCARTRPRSAPTPTARRFARASARSWLPR